jgi:hypothetical protein
MRLSIVLILTAMTLQAQHTEQTNKHFWHTVETTANPETIWNIWTDVANWKNWDLGLKDASMDETFSLHAKGNIISLEGRKSKFKIVALEEGKSYTFKTKLLLSSLYVKRSLTVQDGKTLFTHEVWFKGFTAGIFAKAFGGDFRALLPKAMDKIKEIAEQQ